MACVFTAEFSTLLEDKSKSLIFRGFRKDFLWLYKKRPFRLYLLNIFDELFPLLPPPRISPQCGFSRSWRRGGETWWTISLTCIVNSSNIAIYVINKYDIP